MVKYTIKMLQRALDDLDNIYYPIADDFRRNRYCEEDGCDCYCQIYTK